MTTRQQRRLEERKTRKNASKLAATPLEAAANSDRAEANKQNAQHSTGPRTPEGKINSSKNSFKHGLYAKQLVLVGEDPAELDALREDLRREHQPGTTTEEILVNELAEHYWRLRRMRKYEARIMGSGSLEELQKGFALLPIMQRTMAAAERGFHKSLNALRQLQKERAVRSVADSPLGQMRAPGEHRGFVSQNAVATADRPSLPTSDQGFVSQNDQQPVPIHFPAPQIHRFEAA